MNFKTLLPLFLLSFHWSLTNKEANFVQFSFSVSKRIFSFKLDDCGVFVIICYCVTRYENFAVNQKASIFVSYVIKEFAHAFSCAYIEIWMHSGSLESTQEARVALGYRLVQLLRIFRALQTSRVHPYLDIHTLSMNKFLNNVTEKTWVEFYSSIVYYPLQYMNNMWF